MYKTYDFRVKEDIKELKFMKFVISQIYPSGCEEKIKQKIFSLIKKLHVNTVLLSIIYYKRLIDKSDPYWSWIGVLIISDCYLNDKSYNTNAWSGLLNTTKQEIVELKKKILIDLDYYLFCKNTEYISINNSYEDYTDINSFIEEYV